MTMLELQDILGDEMNKLISGTTQPEDAKAVALLAKQMINNADVILRADKLAGKHERTDKVVG